MTIVTKVLACGKDQSMRKSLQRTSINTSKKRTGIFCRNMSENRKDNVLFEKHGTTGIITLNRPKYLNSFDVHMIRSIHRKWTEWEENAETGMIVIKGAGDRAFCAGGDLATVTDKGKKGDIYQANRFFNDVYRFMHAFGTSRIPCVAFIDGVVVGGGLGLSGHGKFRVATERTVFAVPEPSIGFFPDVGASHILPRLGNQLGLYLAFTGLRLKGRDVFEAGVATHVVDSHKLPRLEKHLLELERPSAEDISNVLDEYHSECQTGREKDFALKNHILDISRLFSVDTVEEIIGNLEKEGTEWAEKQLKAMSSMSPTSLKLTLRQMRTGAISDLATCLEMESKLVGGCLRYHDFYAGVKAIFLDKSKTSPQWKPTTLQDVTDSLIDDHFVLGEGMEELVLSKSYDSAKELGRDDMMQMPLNLPSSEAAVQMSLY